MAVRQGFRVGDIQRGAGDLPAAQGVDQVVGDDQFAAAHVDHDGGAFHRLELRRVHQPGGLPGQGHGQDEGVRLAPHVIGRRHGVRLVGALDRATGAVHRDHLHAEGPEHGDQRIRDAAGADDGDRGGVEKPALRGVDGAAGAEGTGERGCFNVVELGEQQGQRDLGDRLPVDPGGVRPADPARTHDPGIDEPVNPGEHELHEADVGGQRVRQLAAGVDEELGVVQIGGELVAGGLDLPDDRIPDAGVHGELQRAERS